uniref:Putative reverse transcriptase domain-containing protein n=1 Tax=Tanacetum cinerariifolium TaxID=118510 RepID=A0A6L2MF85_TANCI|nr:putative reverse transcriptase domain-containing protein [Tanacetum cinerariifolium]
MPPRMTTRSAGDATVAPQRGRTGGRTGKGGGRTKGQSGDQGNGRVYGQGNQGSNQGNPRNQNGDAVNDNILGDEWVTKEEPGEEREWWRAYKDMIMRYRNARDENKRIRTGNAFAITTNPVRREYSGIIPKCVSYNLHHASERPCRACFNYSRRAHIEKDCRLTSRMVNPVNARNPTTAPGACYECGGTDHFKVAYPRLNHAQRPRESVQTKLLLIIRDKVIGTMVTRHVEGCSCWGRRGSPGPKHRDGDYDYEIRYHPGKVNVVADALSRKKRIKPRRIRAMNMTLQLSIKGMKLAAQEEASDESVGLQRGLDKLIECRNNGALYYMDRIWVPLKGNIRTLIMGEAYKSKYSVYPGADKMYYDFKDRYWWPGMKKDTAVYVIVDRLSKSAHFLPIREDYKMNRLAILYLNEIVVRHTMPISIIYDHDSRFTSMFWQATMQEALETRLDMSIPYHPQTNIHSKSTIQTLEYMPRACILDLEGCWDVHLLLVEFAYNNSYHFSVRCAPFEALYGRKCHSLIMWEKVREEHLVRPELVQETTKMISQIKDRLKAKGVVRIGKKGKLAPRFVGPFEITKRIGPVAYRLRLPEEPNSVHDTFRMSNLKKCLADPTLQIPLDEIRVDAKLNFIEEPMEILEREFKKLKRSRITIVKVRWNSKRRPEFMWKREDQMKLKYLHLFSSSNS